MKEKEFIIKKITHMLASFDVISLEAIHKALLNLKKGRYNNGHKTNERTSEMVD